MNFGEAVAIFQNIDLSGRTVSEKRLAIKTVLSMDTHNGITKQEFINALDWLMDHSTAYDVDKIVERLELLSENAENNALNTYEEKAAYGTAYSKAIEVIKAGGVNG